MLICWNCFGSNNFKLLSLCKFYIGGKTTHLASLMEDKVRARANSVSLQTVRLCLITVVPWLAPKQQ